MKLFLQNLKRVKSYSKPTLPQIKNYNELVTQFKWNIPKYFNIGFEISDKHVLEGNGEKTALIFEDHGEVKNYSFNHIKKYSDKFAIALSKLDYKLQDRVAILLGQCPETLISHASIFKLGGISLPLFTLFGPDALHYRLKDSQAKFLILGDEESYEKIKQIIDDLPDLKVIISTSTHKIPDSIGNVKVYSFWKLIDEIVNEERFAPLNTLAEDPSFIIYTSGTTGNPKGCLHSHRVLIGHLPGVEYPNSFFPKPGDIFWTPADWAWIGGMMDVLIPSVYFGIPVLANREKKFDPEKAMHLMNKHNVKNAFMPPTALKLIKSSNTKLKANLRSIGSGGESLGENLLSWGRETFGITIHEFYGQTEANLLIGNCSDVTPVKVGSMGKAIPGRKIEIINEKGEILPNGQIGVIGSIATDPVTFKCYWNKPKQTTEKFSQDGKWLLTGDLGKKDNDGYFTFIGRDDDIIKTAGYRVGPCEIEDCISKHHSVKVVAVVGSPDELRNEVVKAFIVLKDEYQNDISNHETLKSEIQNFVKTKLAAYEYPRKIEFIKELPMTTTGKIIRKELREREFKKK